MSANIVRKARWAAFAVLLFAASGGMGTTRSYAQAECRQFSETGQTVCGRFLQYWQTHGGLAQQGFPISGVLGERSEVDGKLYTVQYFERAIFELHPENASPNDVLLSLLGNFRYKSKYPQEAQNQTASASSGAIVFKETGKTLGGVFLSYWQSHGGLAQQGFPISEEFTEVSDLDGKPYTVQYFERAVFELHPENPEASRVLLSQLGTFRYRERSGAGAWVEAPVPVPPALPDSSASPVPTARSTEGPRSTPTPTPTPPTPRLPPGGQTGEIVIANIFYNGLDNPTEGDEYATIKSKAATDTQLQGYRLNAGSQGQDFTFPEYTLKAGAEVRVYTNRDIAGSFSFHSALPLWNNSGDCGYLYDAKGSEVSRLCYTATQ